MLICIYHEPRVKFLLGRILKPMNETSKISDISDKDISKNKLPSSLEAFAKSVYSRSKTVDTSQKAVSDSALDVAAKPAVKPENQWTVAVDLTLSPYIPATDGQKGYQLGGKSQLEQIEKLRKESINKPVTIIAQLVVPSSDSPSSPPSSKLERFEIKNGKITKLKTEPSQGFSQDVKSLLALAASQEPASKLGLIVQSHGDGAGGLDGDNGPTTLNKFVDAVKEGLQGSGHKQLDMLDFDSCLMGTSEVLDKVKSITSHVVASAELDEGNQYYDAQNLKAILSDVLNKPAMTGGQLGDDIVAEANKGANGDVHHKNGSTESGTHVLAEFDLKHYEHFNKAFNQFGKDLSQAMQNPANLKQIQKDIDDTFRYSAPTDQHQLTDQQTRDLKTFATSIEKDIKSGKIIDPKGDLLKSADGLLKAESQLVTSFHGDTYGHYNKLGGLSTFLPSALSQNIQHHVDDISPFRSLSKGLEKFISDKNLSNDEIKRVKDFVDGSLKMLETMIPNDQSSQLSSLKANVKELDQSSNNENIQKALAKIYAESKILESSQISQKFDNQIGHMAKIIETNNFNSEQSPDDPGWNAFLKKLEELDLK